MRAKLASKQKQRTGWHRLFGKSTHNPGCMRQYGCPQPVTDRLHNKDLVRATRKRLDAKMAATNTSMARNNIYCYCYN